MTKKKPAKSKILSAKKVAEKLLKSSKNDLETIISEELTAIIGNNVKSGTFSDVKWHVNPDELNITSHLVDRVGLILNALIAFGYSWDAKEINDALLNHKHRLQNVTAIDRLKRELIHSRENYDHVMLAVDKFLTTGDPKDMIMLANVYTAVKNGEPKYPLSMTKKSTVPFFPQLEEGLKTR